MPDIEIAVENTPAVPGLRFRHFRGESDYPAMLEVLLSSEEADNNKRADTLDGLTENYRHLTNCDPYRDMIFAEIGAEMVAYARGWWSDDPSGARIYNIVGFLAPAWRRWGIGSAMLGWMESHLRGNSADHPSNLPKYFQVEVSHAQVGTMKMLAGSGYQPVRYFYQMLRPALDDLTDLPLPTGVEVRPVMPEQYRAIWRSVDETSVDEWGYKKPAEEDYRAWLADPHFQPNLWQVAWEQEGGRVAGHVLTYIDHAENEAYQRKRGYTEGIGVDRIWRRRGLASALIMRSLKAQKEAGMHESALIVDGENSGATSLYERCGFQVVSWNAIYRKPL